MKILLAVILFPCIAFGQSITGFSGTLSDGELVVISGSSFGDNGPNVYLFESFQRGVAGQEVDSGCDVGEWVYMEQGLTPTFIADDVSGSSNIAGRMIVAGVKQDLITEFVGVQEFFLSYRVKIPDGKHFPNAFAEETFSDGSNWKVAWIMDGYYGYYGNDDYCLPTWPNGTYWQIAGNDVASQTEVGRPGTATQWFDWDVWNRFSVYMKGGLPDPIENFGVIWSQGMSEQYGQQVFSRTDTRIFDGDDSGDFPQDRGEDDDVSQWTHFYCPGWSRGTDVNSEGWYDDIYLAIGPNAIARVEIGNNAMYSSCTKLDISTPTSWSDNSIVVTFRAPSFSNSESAFLFVVDSVGNISEGFNVTLDSNNGNEIMGPPSNVILNGGD